MDRFFNANNPLMRFLSSLVDLAVLNVLTILTSIPIVTFGPSMAGLNHVLIHLIRKDETYVWKMYLRSFRENLGGGIRIGLCCLAYIAVAAGDLLLLRRLNTRMTTGLMFLITILSCFVFVWAVYAFALQARYENTVRGTLTNALMLFIGHLPVSLGILAIWLVWGIFLRLTGEGAALWFLLYGFSLPGYLSARLYDPIFRKMEPDEEE